MKSMLFELLICVVHPPPQWWHGSGSSTGSGSDGSGSGSGLDDSGSGSGGGRTSSATVLDERFSLFMFARLYLLTRWVWLDWYLHM
jgi:hypothetical protein